MSGTIPPVANPAEQVSDAELAGSLASLKAEVLAGIAEASVKPGELKAFKAGSVPLGWTQTAGPTTGASGFLPYQLTGSFAGSSPTLNVRLATSGGALYALYSNSTTMFFERFNEAFGTWEALPNPGVTANASVPLGPLIALPSGKLLYASISATAGTTTARVFDPATSTWGPAAAMPTASRGGGGFLLADGSAYVSGDGATGYAYIEASNSWVTKAKNPLQVANDAFHAICSLGNGKALAVSGTAYRLYDEATDTWEAAQTVQNGISIADESPLFRIGFAVYAANPGVLTAEYNLRSYSVGLNTWSTLTEVSLAANVNGSDATTFSDGAAAWNLGSAPRRLARRSNAVLPVAIVWATKD